MLSRYVRHHKTHLYAVEVCQASQQALVRLQVTDMRTQKEIATYRGHNRDVTCAAWHPLHEELFASGGYDGSLMYWLVSNPEPQVLLPFIAFEHSSSLPFDLLGSCLSWQPLAPSPRGACWQRPEAIVYCPVADAEPQQLLRLDTAVHLLE